MKTLNLTLAAIALSAFSTVAQAQDSGAYGTLGVSSYDFDTYNATGRLGYNFNQFFGVEGEGSVGVSGYDEDEIEVDTKWDLGAYAVARVPLGESFEAFVRGGYSIVHVDVRAGTDTSSKDVDGFAFGGGLQYNIDSQSGLRAGYTRKEGNIGGVVVDGDVWDVSYVRKF